MYNNDIEYQKYHWQHKTVKKQIDLQIQGQNKIISLHFDMKMYQINHLLTRHQICDSQRQISAKQQHLYTCTFRYISNDIHEQGYHVFAGSKEKV